MSEHDGWKYQGRQENGEFGSGTKPKDMPKNRRDLAAVIQTEAEELSEAGKAAVGWTVLNRMRRNKTNAVQDVWTAYGQRRETDGQGVARRILSGEIPDPTHGATHIYTPERMRREGQPGNLQDTAGGIESAPGVVDAPKNPGRNYRPGSTLQFEQKIVPSVPEAKFKFYKAPGDGPVDPKRSRHGH